MVTRTTTRIGLWAALLGALGSGCAGASGGQTGDEDGTPCWNKITPLALDAVSPLGFSPRESLNLAVGEHSAVLHWIPAVQFPYGPESGSGELHVTVESLGNARFATHEGNEATTELDYCSPSVLSDVSVDVDSAGGALREHFQTLLVATTKDAAGLGATLLGDHIAGNFAFDPAGLGDRTLAQVTLNSRFSIGSFSGTFSAGLEQRNGDGATGTVSLQYVPLACWGSAGPPLAGCAE